MADSVKDRTFRRREIKASPNAHPSCHGESSPPSRASDRFKSLLGPPLGAAQGSAAGHPLAHKAIPQLFTALCYEETTGRFNQDVRLREDQDFNAVATVWEKRYSLIFHPTDKQLAVPAVNTAGTVIGYVIESQKDRLWTLPDGTMRYEKIANADQRKMMGLQEAERGPGGGECFLTVLMDIDGYVSAVLNERRVGNAQSANWEVVEVVLFVTGLPGLAKLAFTVVKAGLRVFARMAVRKMLSRQGLRLTRGYDPRMGIPSEHLSKMIAAAKETDSIAVFRANKLAAVPLIRKGAIPKGKIFFSPTLKTSPRTGVLMAKESGDVATVYKNGYYIVGRDGVARQTVNGVTKELRLKNPFWTVEEGQVVAADGMPVVGDYDLLGVLPRSSPGRNIAAVPKGGAGDWVGPDVQKFADAVNRRLDTKRVLHGAQDQFHHPQYGGLTDDVAYAVYPDGSICMLEGREAQMAFYKAYGRQHALGQYARPAAGAAVPDEVAAMRARKQLVK